MRMIAAMLLMGAAACDVETTGNETTIRYDGQKIEDVADDIGNAAERSAAEVGNAADGAIGRVENEVDAIDVDVDVRREEPGNGT